MAQSEHPPAAAPETAAPPAPPAAPQGAPQAAQAPAPDDKRKAQDPVLADFVLALTKAMLRTGYYSRTHPEGQRAMAGLHDAFTDMMFDRGLEFSFQVSRAKAGGEDQDVACDDGKGRVQLLRDVLSEGVADTFLPKLIEYFRRQGLLSFNIKKNIARKDFEIFVERMTQALPAGATNPGAALSHDLATQGVRGISVVFDEDRIAGLAGNVPWRVELALARLKKDLRMLPMLANASDDEIRALKTRLMDDILRGIQEVDLIVSLARHLGAAVMDQKIMTRTEAEQHLILAIQDVQLAPIAVKFAEPWVIHKGHAIGEGDKNNDELDEDRRCRQRLIKQLVPRLIKLDNEKGNMALVKLAQKGYVDPDALPEKIRLTIRAGALADACLTDPELLARLMDHSKSADPFGETIRDLELVSSELMNQKQWEAAGAMTRSLWQYTKGDVAVPSGGAEAAFKALAGLGKPPVIEAVSKALLDTPHDQQAPIRGLVGWLEPEHGMQIAMRVLRDTQDTGLRHWSMETLERLSWDVPGFLMHAVADKEAPWFLVRNLLTVIKKVKDTHAYTAVTQLVSHEKTQVVTEALLTLAELSPDRALRILSRSLEDGGAPEVRRTAALAIAGVASVDGATVRRLITLLEDDKQQEGLRLQVTSTLGAIASRGPQAPKRAEILQALRAILEDKHGSRVHRLKRFAKNKLPPPPHLVAAVCHALAAVKDTEDIKLIEACLHDESALVVDAAKAALAKLRAPRATGSFPVPTA